MRYWLLLPFFIITAINALGQSMEPQPTAPSNDTIYCAETGIVNFRSLTGTSSVLSLTNFIPTIPLPVYQQGFFCNFEDNINRNRKLRIDFAVK